MRAVVEHHEEGTKLPPINVHICKGREDVTIKVGNAAFFTRWLIILFANVRCSLISPLLRHFNSAQLGIVLFTQRGVCVVYRCLIEVAAFLAVLSASCSTTCTPQPPGHPHLTKPTWHHWWVELNLSLVGLKSIVMRLADFYCWIIAGWLWLWSATVTSLREIPKRWFVAKFYGGLRHWCSCLLEGTHQAYMQIILHDHVCIHK